MLRLKYLSLLTIIPGIALSQERDSVNRILPIEEVVITGQFQPTTLKNSVYKIKSIDRDYIQKRATTDMATLLNTELGIRFSNDLTLGESDIQLMGMSGQNVKVLIDGVPMVDRGSTKQSLSQVDVNTIQRIEIVEGPVSVMYGTDALAGVINIITQDPQTGTYKLGINARILEESVANEYKPVGNEGRHNAHVGFNYGIKRWNFNWNGSMNNFGGFQGTSTDRSLQWQPKDQWLTSARIGYTNKEKISAWYNINYLNEDLYTPGAIAANYKYVDKNYITNRFTQILQAQLNVKQNLFLNGSFSYQNYKRRTITELFDLNTQTSALTTGQGEQDVSTFNQAFARINGTYNLAQNIGLLAGLEFNYNVGSGERIINNAEIYDFAAFVSAEYKPQSWLLIRPGLRFIHNSIYNAPPAVPSLNAKVIINPSWDLRLGYAMGFRAPSLRELYFTFHDSNHAINGNTNLKAEHNQNFNANINYNTKWSEHSYFSSSLSGFYNHFNNLIDIGQDLETPTISTYLNVGKFKTTGGTFENSLQYKNSKVNLGAAYTGRYNDLFNENRSLGSFFWTTELNGTLTQTFPRLKANINLFYKLSGKRPGYRISGSGDQMEVFESYQKAYSQLDISINKELYRYITLQAGVRNLTNTTNVFNTTTESTSAHATNSSSIPVSYGRSVFFGLLYQINKY